MEAEEFYNEGPDDVPYRPPFNPRAMMHGYGWGPGDSGMPVYIDGSTGFRHGGKNCGIAVYWMGHYWGYATHVLGPNYIEMAACKVVYELIHVRPLVIYTDSSYVQKHGPTDRDTKIVWIPRCSTPEMKFVDTLAKLCACSGQNNCGQGVKDIVSFTADCDKLLMALYDRHYGKGGPCDQRV